MKHFTAKQVALEVLKKAEECLKKAEFLKSEARIDKKGKDVTPPDSVEKQVAPEKNPKEKAEMKGTHPTGMADVEDKRLKKGELKKDGATINSQIGFPFGKKEGTKKLAKFMEDHQSKRLSKGEKNG